MTDPLGLTPDQRFVSDFYTGGRVLAAAVHESERRMREIETRIAVKTGYACPAPGCGLRYRHQHGEAWWPSEGEPWPPRRGPK